MALALTFMTTPLTISVYPPKHRIAAIPLVRPSKGEEQKTIERRPEPGDDGFKS